MPLVVFVDNKIKKKKTCVLEEEEQLLLGAAISHLPIVKLSHMASFITYTFLTIPLLPAVLMLIEADRRI